MRAFKGNRVVLYFSQKGRGVDDREEKGEEGILK